jgi:hypothetical protein
MFFSAATLAIVIDSRGSALNVAYWIGCHSRKAEFAVKV